MTNLDDLIRRYADLNARQADLLNEIAAIKNQIRDTYDCGVYNAAGLKVTIREPNRIFDVDAAVAMLPEQVRETCQVTSYDPRRVKSYLAPAVTDLCYKPGTGNRIVTISQ